MLHVTVKLKPPCTMVKVIESIGTLSLFTAEKKFSGARGKSGNNFFCLLLFVIILSVHYKTISTIYVQVK